MTTVWCCCSVCSAVHGAQLTAAMTEMVGGGVGPNRQDHQSTTTFVALVTRFGTQYSYTYTAGTMPKTAKSRQRVRASGPIADKSKGQHFLKNPLVVTGIVAKAALVSMLCACVCDSLAVTTSLSLSLTLCTTETN